MEKLMIEELNILMKMEMIQMQPLESNQHHQELLQGSLLMDQN